MSRTKAWQNLASAGVNTLILNNPDYLDIASDNTNSHIQFTIEDVPCCVSSKSIGYGEDIITVIFGSNDTNISSKINNCYFPNFSKDIKKIYKGQTITVIKMILERRSGKYIMDNSVSFSTNKTHLSSLTQINILPNGFSLSGPFIF